MFTDHLLASLWLAIICLPLISASCCYFLQRWRIAGWLIGGGLVTSILAWLGIVFVQSQGSGLSLFYITPLKASVLVLIQFIAFIVLRYAQANFSGDPDNQRFLRWLMLTVFSVMVTVSSDNLLVFWLSWLGISLSLHQLLMFYPNRPRAALAAHKKFILARLAELLLALAFGLLYLAHGSLSISAILSHYPSADFGWQQQCAAVLLAMVALIKCAQLPLHGWLIQVVEAPTPVSSLLHAGVINMGGYLLILFAPVFDQSWPAKWLVLVVAGLSTVLAALIMMTRVSVKVRLAWSTTAQMGLMLSECALGLYQLALLHLLAHSFYKAHAFLNSGDEVNIFLRRELTDIQLPGLKAWGLSIFTSVILVSLIVILVGGANNPLSPWLLVGMAIAQTLAFYFNEPTEGFMTNGLIKALLLLGGYTVAKTASGFLVADIPFNYNLAADFWMGLLFLGLFSVYQTLQYHPSNPMARRLFIALNAGLYLDEWVTSMTLKCWPLHLPRTKTPVGSLPTEAL